MSNKCPKCGSAYFGVREDDTCLSCGWQRVTVFDRIAASPDVLAEKLVYQSEDEFGDVTWSSTIVFGWYVGREDCIAATMERLKEVEK